MERIGVRLKRLRTKCGLSQTMTANFLNVPPTTYRDWENGKNITGEPYLKLADLFGVSLVEIITGESMKNSDLIRELDELQEHIKIIRKIALALD